ncbi:group XIIB secretory phospholipase A2-like protein isoform X2 [Nothobranchius furzeri]|uniref:Phospholipase A2, group XIIB n=1 Tax=Nothobranchius furzeri TaxID=105023 RepID=A0A8C6L793_NOTFU|nr:group XIIB secretory phospholipase A2-like protein isoform X2 [Nothobranchius furzeri]KAF7220096.1 transcript variant X2 [Nothobranchius furzeri]
MLLRTVVLLVCVSLGTCATLGYYHNGEKEEAVVIDAGGAADPQVEPNVKTRPVENQGAAQPEVELHTAGLETGSAKLYLEAVTKEETPAGEEANEIRPVQTSRSPSKPEEETSGWSLNSIRNSFQTVHGYFDSLVELVGGRDGVCQYRCRYGEHPQPRPGYQLQEPNGCSSSLVGFQLDMGIPAMTKCCNQLDICYDTCGVNKYDCDAKFRSCLHDICSDLKKSLGFVSKVQACGSMADALYNTVWTLGCRPYMNSQRAACICEGEERDEL